VGLPPGATDAEHTVLALGESSDTGGSAGLVIFTGWDGLRGDLTTALIPGTGQPVPPNGTRAQLDELAMSARQMADGSMVRIGGTLPGACESPGGPTWTLSELSANVFRPVMTDPCSTAENLIWLFDSARGIGVAAINQTACIDRNVPLSPVPTTQYDFAGIDLFGDDLGTMHAVGDTGTGGSCGQEQPGFPVSSADPAVGIAAARIRSSPVPFTPDDHNYYVVFASENGTLHANCAGGSTCRTGQQLWNPALVRSGLSRTAPSPVDATPLIDQGIAYVPSTDGNVYDYSMSDGQQRLLPFHVGSAVFSSPVLYDSRLYFGADDGNLYCVDEDMAVCPDWTPRKPMTRGSIRSTPSVARGVVYITSEDNHLYAFRASTGAKVWASSLPTRRPPFTSGPFNSSPAYVDGVVYAGGTDGGLYAFDASTGRLVPGFPRFTRGPIFASPAVGDGFVSVTDMTGLTWVLTPIAHGLFVGE
jgi:outer membrane protein assembly factor BamB